MSDGIKEPREQKAQEANNQPSFPDYVKILPYHFGFIHENQFIQGTFFIDKRANNRVDAMGHLPDGIEYSSLGELSQKTKWGQDTLKLFIDKIQGIINRQQANQFK